MGIRSRGKTVPRTAACLRYGCKDQVSFNIHKPPLYCSDRCRTLAFKEQEWLVEQIRRVREELVGPKVSPARRELLASREHEMLWHLRRYSPAAVDGALLQQLYQLDSRVVCDD